MPNASINTVLERAEKTKTKVQQELLDFRGPGNTIFVLRVLTDNVRGLKNDLNHIFKKYGCMFSDGKSSNAFDHSGFVITEIKGDLDAATDDAITVGAEEVEEIDDNGKLYRVKPHIYF